MTVLDCPPSWKEYEMEVGTEVFYDILEVGGGPRGSDVREDSVVSDISSGLRSHGRRNSEIREKKRGEKNLSLWKVPKTSTEIKGLWVQVMYTDVS